jgi:hypothetical protein
MTNTSDMMIPILISVQRVGTLLGLLFRPVAFCTLAWGYVLSDSSFHVYIANISNL